jgi:hypothetical protein
MLDGLTTTDNSFQDVENTEWLYLDCLQDVEVRNTGTQILPRVMALQVAGLSSRQCYPVNMLTHGDCRLAHLLRMCSLHRLLEI